MRRTKKIGLILCLFYLLVVAGPVFAQVELPPLSACVGSNVAGTVIAVDAAEMIVTLEMMDGTICTVTLAEGDYNHPVIALLGTYFDDVSVESLSDSLQALQGCVLFDEAGGTWTWVNCDTQGALPVKVTDVDEMGGFMGTLVGTGEEVTIQVNDPLVSDALNENLNALLVSWQLNETGTVAEVGDEIAQYHDDGIGFGVLVKLYAMSAEAQEACVESGAVDDPACGITVEELVAQIQNEGLGMGDLFEIYGKPAMLGVGHVRQDLRDGKGKPEWAGPKDKTEDELAPLDPDDVQNEEQHGPPDHANGNSNKDKDKGKDKDKHGKPDHVGPPDGKGKP